MACWSERETLQAVTICTEPKQRPSSSTIFRARFLPSETWRTQTGPMNSSRTAMGLLGDDSKNGRTQLREITSITAMVHLVTCGILGPQRETQRRATTATSLAHGTSWS